MLFGLLISWAILAVTFAVTSWLLTGMDVSGGFWGYVWVSLLFGIVNAFLLYVTDALTDHLTIDSFFWTAIWAAIIIAVVSLVLHLVVSPLVGSRRRAQLT